MNAKEISTSILGEYKSVFKGVGLEFEEYRRYEAGHDDAKGIDWKASLRASDLLIKTYIEERNLNIFIAVDVSSSMLLGSSKMLKYEYAANIAALSGTIAKAKPNLQDKITNKLLDIDKTHHSSECKNIIKGKAILSFDEFIDEFDDKEKIIQFVKKELKNTRSATRKKAENLLKKWDI